MSPSRLAPVLALGALLAFTTAAAQNNQIKIAAVLGLTGAAAPQATGIRNGIELAKEDLAKDGVVVDILYEDDQTNPAKTVSAIHSLIARGYSLFVGPTWSFQVNAARSLLNSSGVVAVVPGGSSDINGGSGPGIFNLCPPRGRGLERVQEWIRNSKISKAFIYTPNGDWGEIHRRIFRDALNSENAAIVGEDQFDYGVDAATVRMVMLRAARAGAEAVLSTGAAGDVANLIRARNALHLELSVLSTEDGSEAIGLGLLTMEEAASRVWLLVPPISSTFAERYKERFREPPSGYAERGYDALMVLARAVQQAGLDKAQIKALLRSRFDYQGITGRIRFDENGDLRDGQYRLITAKEAAADY